MLSILAAVLAGTATIAPLRAAEFRDAVGVNIHVEYTDGGYRDLTQVIEALRYIGVDKVRDAAPNPGNQGQGGYLALAKAGVRFDLFVNGEAIGAAIRRLAALVHDAPGSLLSVEGPNEVNNLGGLTFEDVRDPHIAAVAYQAALYRQVRAEPSLTGVPVVTFTDYPVRGGSSDLGNFHSYPKGGDAPEPQFLSDLSAARQSTPGRPIIATEMGFSTVNAPDGVSELAQARLLLASLLDIAAFDVHRVYIYQLLDAYPDPDHRDSGRHYGLFDTRYRPKPSARMLHRLMAVLDDHSSQARGFAPVPAKIELSGENDEVRHLIIEKADGEVIVALWRAIAAFKPATREDLDPPARKVGLRLRAPHGAIRVVDLIGAAEGDVDAARTAVTVSLGANPLLIRIAPAAVAGQRSGEEPSPSKK